MEKRTLLQQDFTQLSQITGFQDNGDVDFHNSVACFDDNGAIISAIVIGNITNHPTLGKSIPIIDEKGSAQVLLLYINNNSSYGTLYELLKDFIGNFLPFKVLWCSTSEYTEEGLLTRLGFQYHVSGIAKTFYLMIN